MCLADDEGVFSVLWNVELFIFWLVRFRVAGIWSRRTFLFLLLQKCRCLATMSHKMHSILKWSLLSLSHGNWIEWVSEDSAGASRKVIDWILWFLQGLPAQSWATRIPPADSTRLSRATGRQKACGALVTLKTLNSYWSLFLHALFKMHKTESRTFLKVNFWICVIA